MGVFWMDLRPRHSTPESTRHLSKISVKSENQDKPLFGLIDGILKSNENRGQSTKKMASTANAGSTRTYGRSVSVEQQDCQEDATLLIQQPLG